MNKKPEVTKQLLEKALQELPSDMTTARFHIKRAINEVAQVIDKEIKKSQKPTPRQQWQLNLETGTLANPNLSPVVLKGLDALIAQEQAKIDSIKKSIPTPPHYNVPNVPSSLFTG